MPSQIHRQKGYLPGILTLSQVSFPFWQPPAFCSRTDPREDLSFECIAAGSAKSARFHTGCLQTTMKIKGLHAGSTSPLLSIIDFPLFMASQKFLQRLGFWTCICMLCNLEFEPPLASCYHRPSKRAIKAQMCATKPQEIRRTSR